MRRRLDRGNSGNCPFLYCLIWPSRPGGAARGGAPRWRSSRPVSPACRSRISPLRLERPTVGSASRSAGLPDGDEPFASMVKRLPRSPPSTALLLQGDQAPDRRHRQSGSLLYSGRMGTALAITPDGQAIVKRSPGAIPPTGPAIETVLACGPALVMTGPWTSPGTGRLS